MDSPVRLPVSAILLAHIGPRGILGRDLVSLCRRLGITPEARDGALRALQRGLLLVRIPEGEHIRFMRPEYVRRPTDHDPAPEQTAMGKAAGKAVKTRTRKPGVPQPHAAPPGKLWCSRKGHWALLLDFNRKKDTPRGYAAWCRKCKCDHQREKRRGLI